MSILEAMARASEQAGKDTVTLDGIMYQIQRVDSERLIEIGSATLFAARPIHEGYAASPSAKAAFNSSVAFLAAGVVAVSRDGAEWEPLRIVGTKEEGNAAEGRLWIEHMLPGHATALQKAVNEISTKGGRAAKLVGSFLGNPASDAASRGE